ncbi:MAG: ATP-binding protein [Methanobrevibacter sp.]|jgi:hypothetical protein|nr:ATP-binding protein [Candidatus Methanoflexus mossambicus]
MSFLHNKHIDFITEEDINHLIKNQISEDENLDYKREIDIQNKKNKESFLKEVCAFCNANGGLLIYGIGENDDKFPVLNGLDLKITMDDLKLRLASLLRDCLEPSPVSHINIRELTIEDKQILLIKCSKSINGPIRLNKTRDFYIRHNNGCEHMNYDELRNAFNLSDNLHEKIISFKNKRLKYVLERGDLSKHHGIILHIIPFDSLKSGKYYDLNSILNNNNFQPLFSSGITKNNFDGIINGDFDDSFINYIQMFDNGIIEFVSICDKHKNDKLRSFYAYTFEKKIITRLVSIFNIYKYLDIPLPIFIFLTVVGIENMEIYNGRNAYTACKFDRNCLELPEVVINSYDLTKNESELEKEFKFTFDKIYYSAGNREGSPNYDNEDNWKSLKSF